MSRIKIFALISALAISTLACSLTSRIQQEAAEAAATQISESMPSQSGADGESSHPAAADLQSFRMIMTYTVQAADGSVMQSLQTSGEYVNSDPPAEHFIATVGQDGDSGENQIMEIIQVNHQIWMQFDGRWMSVNGSPDMGFINDDLIEEFTTDEIPASWEKLGTETVHGMKTTRYRTSEEAASILSEMSFPNEADTNDHLTLTTAETEVYVNSDGLIVKRTLHAEAEMQQDDGSTQPVTVDYNFEIYDINDASIEIKPPEGEDVANLQEAPIPMPESATAIMNTNGLNVYSIPDMDIAGVVDFIANSEGVTITSKMGSDSDGYVLMLSYEGKNYTVTLSPGESGGVDISIIGQGN